MFDDKNQGDEPQATYIQRPTTDSHRTLKLASLALFIVTFVVGTSVLVVVFATPFVRHADNASTSMGQATEQTSDAPDAVSPVTIESDSDTDDELVEVPNVVGLPLDQASQTLEDAGFSVASYSTITAYYTPGTVSDQSLKGWAPTGSTVLLDYCKTYDEANHPESSAIDNPDVHGLTIDQATELIAERGLPAPTEIDGPSDGIVTEYVHISETDTYALYTVSIEQ